MMKLDIHTQDRFGITQDVLLVISKRGWELLSMEMQPCHIFIHLSTQEEAFLEVEATLADVTGVRAVIPISFLPNERRSHYLDSLFTTLPDPIIDIAPNGDVIVANQAAASLLRCSIATLEADNLASYMDFPLSRVFSTSLPSMEVSIGENIFWVNITRIWAKEVVSGAVLVFRSPQRLGQELSLLNSSGRQLAAGIIGNSIAITEAVEQSKRFAELSMPVLLNGETGTGKELFARGLHENSSRKTKPFLAINCAALPENLLESELFGYTQGAFSGAAKGGKPGLFELSHQGTVFLDEIGEMSSYLQAKLLRFLENYKVRRIGGSKELSVDVRIVSATHRNLLDMVKDGGFREDLYYRLNVLNIRLPALRERKEDIGMLAQHFLMLAAKQTNRTVTGLSDAAIQRLSMNSWPGNVRQLQNVIFRSVALSDHPLLDKEDIKFITNDEPEIVTDSLVTIPEWSQATTWKDAQAQFEKQLLLALYPEYPSVRKLASRLAVSHNKIAMKLREHNIQK